MATRIAALRTALERFCYSCSTLDDPSAMTGRAIRDAVFAAARELTADDLLIVHVLSHGQISVTGRLTLIDAAGNADTDNGVGELQGCWPCGCRIPRPPWSRRIRVSGQDLALIDPVTAGRIASNH